MLPSPRYRRGRARPSRRRGLLGADGAEASGGGGHSRPSGRSGEGRGAVLAGGCAACHAAPGAKGDDKLILSGGEAIVRRSYFPSAEHLARQDAWHRQLVDARLVNAMKRGLGPGGEHLYPSFPYTSYKRMPIGDLVDLKAYLDTLPPSAADAPQHELPFPFSIRRGLGLWKLLYLDGETFEPDPAKSDEINRGAYLVEGPGHCNECHNAAQHARRAGLLASSRRGAQSVVQGLHPEHHRWQGRHRRLVGRGHRTTSRDRSDAGLRQRRRNHGRRPGEHGPAPRSDREAIAAYLKDLPRSTEATAAATDHSTFFNVRCRNGRPFSDMAVKRMARFRPSAVPSERCDAVRHSFL